MNKREEVISFINKFTNNGKRQEVIECFTCGCCYWFAKILEERFMAVSNQANTFMVYDEIANHYACQIDNRIYDITGDITDIDDYYWEVWELMKYKDGLLWDRLIRDCIEMRNE